MKKLIFFISLVLTGLMTSCVDKNEEVDADSKPDWLHGSIYEELKNPTSGGLTGSFNTYLRLVDDLGYAETLNRTGSKTVFPANDEAFSRFFQANDWGVTSYEELTVAQKKLLLYSSMIDNALLVGMLPNVSNGSTEVLKGMAVKHATSVNVIDTITHVYGLADMPRNNKYWAKYAQGIDVVRDATAPMMVHFTREQMINNSITTTGEGSDFEILTGSPYTEGSAYIFNNKVIKSDITCMNGYVHQLENVLVPPGNMAQVIEKNKETSIFSRVLDYFSAPYYDLRTTNNYNDWAVTNGYPVKDSIFQVRYLSSRSQDAALVIDPDGNTLSSSRVLSYDPGWNQYCPSNAYSTAIDYKITDIGAMFVPDDDAMREYFLPGGNGAFLIDIYGNKANTAENLLENLDSLHAKNPQVLTSFVRNLQKPSFVGTVPSKFSTITNDASENMGMNLGYLNRTADNKYDIRFANNGVIYVLNNMVAPDEYQAVLAPSSSYSDMQVMNWAVQDKGTNGETQSSYLGVDFFYYLLAMSANYAFFIPDDAAFDAYYVDPVTLGWSQPEALHFYYDAKHNPTLRADRYKYDLATNEVGERIGEIQISKTGTGARYKTQLIDILNYHTVVLNAGETIGSNHYYKTKHGGEIYVTGGNEGNEVMSGAQIDNGVARSTIENVYNEKNGNAYRLNHVIQAPHNSVSKTLRSYDCFSEFYRVCSGFAATNLLSWVGISGEVNSFGTTEQDQYTVFTSTYGTGTNAIQNACLDENIKMFNTYNYTLYAPDNDAMQKAYAAGLPSWESIEALFNKYDHEEGGDETPEEDQDKALAYSMIKSLRDFVRYHFQSVSLYADNTVEGGNYQTLCSDAVGVADEVEVSGGGNKIVITDRAGVSRTVDANDGTKVSNKMARDYWFNKQRTAADAITTSSFCAVHEITEPLYLEANKRYDNNWSNSNARVKAAKNYKRLKAINKL